MGLLWDPGDGGTAMVQPQLDEADAIDKDIPAHHLIETEEGGQEGKLPTARTSNHTHLYTK